MCPNCAQARMLATTQAQLIETPQQQLAMTREQLRAAGGGAALPEGVPGRVGLPKVKNMDELAAAIGEDKGALRDLSEHELGKLLEQECVVTVVGKKRIMDEARALQNTEDKRLGLTCIQIKEKRGRDSIYVCICGQQCKCGMCSAPLPTDKPRRCPAFTCELWSPQPGTLTPPHTHTV